MKKFRAWQNNDLADAYEKAMQVLAKLDEELDNTEGPLPDSIVPTAILAKVCIAYIDSFEKLAELDMVSGGYVVGNKTLH